MAPVRNMVLLLFFCGEAVILNPTGLERNLILGFTATMATATMAEMLFGSGLLEATQKLPLEATSDGGSGLALKTITDFLREILPRSNDGKYHYVYVSTAPTTDGPRKPGFLARKAPVRSAKDKNSQDSHTHHSTAPSTDGPLKPGFLARKAPVRSAKDKNNEQIQDSLDLVKLHQYFCSQFYWQIRGSKCILANLENAISKTMQSVRSDEITYWYIREENLAAFAGELAKLSQ